MLKAWFGLGPSYQGCDSFDMCGVTRENAQSVAGREGTTLNVGNDIVGKTSLSSGLGPYNVSGVALLNPLGEVFELRNTSPDVDQNISSRIERTTTTSNHGDTIVPTNVRSHRRDDRDARWQLFSARCPSNHTVTIVIHYIHLSTE